MMKIKTISVGLICLMNFVLTAQSEDDRRFNFEFGAKVGANYSNVWDSNDDVFQADAKLGFAGGVYAGIPIGKFFGLQPEVLISQKGFEGSGTLLGTSYSFTRTSTFLDVPLLLQIKPTSFLTLVVGPQFSYLFKQKDGYTFGSNSTEQEQEFENEDIRKNILGVSLGFDVVYSYFVLSGRACWDFQNNNGDATTTAPRYKNQWLQLTVGVKL